MGAEHQYTACAASYSSAWSLELATDSATGSTGRLAYIEGRLQARTWEAADGSSRHTVEVVADRVQALSPKPAAAVK